MYINMNQAFDEVTAVFQTEVSVGSASLLIVSLLSALSFQVTCTTDSGSASTPTVRYSPVTGLGNTTQTGTLHSKLDWLSLTPLCLCSS